MNEHILYAELFDCYGNLLTLKQQDYMKFYYFDNLTLSEIASNENITRNAVHKTLKEATLKLIDYEDKLHLLSKKKEVIDLIKDEDLKEKIRNILS